MEQLATGAKQLSGLTGIGQVYAGIVNLNNAVSGVNTEGTLQNGTAALKAGIKQIQEQVSALTESTVLAPPCALLNVFARLFNISADTCTVSPSAAFALSAVS